MREATQLNHAPKVRTTLLPSGRSMPVLGQGTWRMGEDPARNKAEVAARTMSNSRSAITKSWTRRSRLRIERSRSRRRNPLLCG